MLVDQDRGGVFVMLFTDHLEEHGAAIAKLVRPGASIESAKPRRPRTTSRR